MKFKKGVIYSLTNETHGSSFKGELRYIKVLGRTVMSGVDHNGVRCHLNVNKDLDALGWVIKGERDAK